MCCYLSQQLRGKWNEVCGKYIQGKSSTQHTQLYSVRAATFWEGKLASHEIAKQIEAYGLLRTNIWIRCLNMQMRKMSSRLIHSKGEQWCLWMQSEWWSWIMDRLTMVHFGMVLSVKLTSNPLTFLPPHSFIITYFLHMSLDRVHICTSCQLIAGSGCSRVPRQGSEGVSYQSTFQILSATGAWTENTLIFSPVPYRLSIHFPVAGLLDPLAKVFFMSYSP